MEPIEISDGHDRLGHESGHPGSTGERVLQRTFETTDRAERFYENAMCGRFTERMQSFVEDRFFAVLGTTDSAGRPVVAPRYGSPGFVRVTDETQLAWAETNVDRDDPSLDDQDVTLTFVDYWDSTVGLHVNGHARRVDEVSGVDANRPGAVDHWAVLDVVEAYIHCAKHAPTLSVVENAPPTKHDPPAPADRLTPAVQSFLGDQILAYLGTVDGSGETDVSPRLGPRGFVQPLDESRLAWPEYRGNGVHASLGNMLETGRGTLSFVDWWRTGTTVAIDGTADLRDDVDGVVDLAGSDRTKTWVVFEVDQVRVQDSFVPSVVVESFDPPWGTDDEGLKKAGYFTEGTPS